jgi:hypothetical protein
MKPGDAASEGLDTQNLGGGQKEGLYVCGVSSGMTVVKREQEIQREDTYKEQMIGVYEVRDRHAWSSKWACMEQQNRHARCNK